MSLAPRNSSPDCAAFVLAGGQSSRMGSDKAILSLAGQPLVAHALRILRAAGFSASIAGARSPLAAFAPVIEDAHAGPLDGICAALSSCSAAQALFLSVDLPLFPSAGLGYLLQQASLSGAAAAMFSMNGFVQTFPAILDHALLPTLRVRLNAGQGGCLTAFRAGAEVLGRPLRILPVEYLVQAGHFAEPHVLPPFLWFLNINTPDDLDTARGLLTQAGRVS